MAEFVPLNSTVEFQSGGVKARGKVLDVHDTAGLFVEADRSVPIVLGQGTKLEYFCTGTKLWLRVKGEVVRDRDGAKTGFMMTDSTLCPTRSRP